MTKEREIELSKSEDNPTSLAVAEGKLFVGVNQGAKEIRAGSNAHLRVFDARDEAQAPEAVGVFSSGLEDEYQKATAAAGDYVAICNSLTPGTLWVFEAGAIAQGATYAKEFEGAVHDVALSPSGERLAVTTHDKIYVLHTATGKALAEIAAGDGSFARARFTSEDALVAAVNAGLRKGWSLRMYSAKGKLLLQRKIVSTGSATAMDAGSKYVVVASSADCEVYVLSATSLAVLTQYKGAHKVAVTAVAINPAETRIASVSVSGTVHVLDVPEGGIFAGGLTSYVWAILSVAVIAGLAVLIQLTLVKGGALDDLLASSKDYFKPRADALSSDAGSLANAATSSVGSVADAASGLADSVVDGANSAESLLSAASASQAVAESAARQLASERSIPEAEARSLVDEAADAAKSADAGEDNLAYEDPERQRLHEEVMKAIQDARQFVSNKVNDFVEKNPHVTETKSLSPEERARRHMPKKLREHGESGAADSAATPEITGLEELAADGENVAIEERLRALLDVVMRESIAAIESRLANGEEVPPSILSKYYSERMATGPASNNAQAPKSA